MAGQPTLRGSIGVFETSHMKLPDIVASILDVLARLKPHLSLPIASPQPQTRLHKVAFRSAKVASRPNTPRNFPRPLNPNTVAFRSAKVAPRPNNPRNPPRPLICELLAAADLDSVFEWRDAEFTPENLGQVFG
ncbi:hypothetical protein Mal65_25110 [Crateriforma conspicua]|nr:hypothetical protein Mal65_25110 [Crateriforma conspicua]